MAGRDDAEQMIDEMPASQMALWVTYQELYGPINPAVRNQVGLASIALMVYQLTSVVVKALSKRRLPRRKLTDFLLFPITTEKEKQAQSAEEQGRILRQLVQITKGRR